MNYLTSFLRGFSILQKQDTPPAPLTSQTEDSFPSDEILSPINHIPEEILQLIFSKMTLSELTNISLVCKRWYCVSKDDILWKNLFYQIFIPEKKQFEDFEYIRVYKAECERKLKAFLKEPEFHYEINKKSEEGQRILVRVAIRFVKHVWPLSRFIHDLDIKSEKGKVELAKIIAIEKPKDLAESIEILGIENNKTIFELAKLVAIYNPVILTTNRPGINSEKARSKLAKLIAVQVPKDLVLHLRNFRIYDEDTRIELAKLVADQNLLVLADHIQKFHITDQKVKTWLAKLVGNRNPLILAESIQNFSITSEADRIDLAIQFVKHRNPLILAANIHNSAYRSEEDRLEIIELAAKLLNGGVINVLEEFENENNQLSSTAKKVLLRHSKKNSLSAIKMGRIEAEIAKIVIPEMRINPEMFESSEFRDFLECIFHFDINDPLALFEIAKQIVSQYMTEASHQYEGLTLSQKQLVFDKFLAIILICFIIEKKSENLKCAYTLATFIPCEKTKSETLSGIVKPLITYQRILLAEEAAKLISQEPTRSLALQKVVNAYALQRNYRDAFELCNEIHDSEIKLHLLEDITKAFFIANHDTQDIEEAKKFMGLLGTACQEEIIRSIINILFSVSHFSHEVKKELALRFGAALATGELSRIVLQLISETK